jgi:hypothetical protein
MEDRDILFNVLLNTHIYHIDSLSAISRLASNICFSKFFWKMKAQHDFGPSCVNGLNAFKACDPISKYEYFKMFKFYDRLVVSNNQLDFWKSYEKILDRLKYLEYKSKVKTSKVFFAEDSRRTCQLPLFEKLSNWMEIGTIAKNGKLGRVLLVFLTVIIDKDFKAPNWIFEELVIDQKPLTISKFINYASSFYAADRFMTDTIFTREILEDTSGKVLFNILYKCISDVDIWTLKRIEKRLRKMHLNTQMIPT